MTAWMKERDKLLEQTMAFVQRVAAANPIAVPRPAAILAPAIEAPATEAAPVELENAVSASSPVVAVKLHPVSSNSSSSHPVSSRPISSHPVGPPAKPMRPVISERADIIERVAAFRAHQGKLIKERAAYYDSVRAKIQTVLDR